jgi:hypothetical protein
VFCSPLIAARKKAAVEGGRRYNVGRDEVMVNVGKSRTHRSSAAPASCKAASSGPSRDAARDKPHSKVSELWCGKKDDRLKRRAGRYESEGRGELRSSVEEL